MSSGTSARRARKWSCIELTVVVTPGRAFPCRASTRRSSVLPRPPSVPTRACGSSSCDTRSTHDKSRVDDRSATLSHARGHGTRFPPDPAAHMSSQVRLGCRGGVMSEGVCAGMVALVTGASKGGTGTAIARWLAAEGARVAITARSVDGLEQTRALIEERGGECFVVPVDLSDPTGGRDELVDQVESALGPVDVLVNNAAANGYV